LIVAWVKVLEFDYSFQESCKSSSYLIVIGNTKKPRYRDREKYGICGFYGLDRYFQGGGKSALM
jgi:hypothetical protein